MTIVHKANVLPLADGLFRDSVKKIFTTEAQRHGGENWEVDELLVDVAAYWGGGLGLAPSINLGDGMAVAEPVHGSAPDIAGKGLANPMAAILSGALLARTVWQREDVAERVETAVRRTLASGIDIYSGEVTQRITHAVLANWGQS